MGKAKQNKYLRKEARKTIGGIFDVLSKITRERPKYIPKFIWIIPCLFFFKRKFWKLVWRRI